jgi:hypothetical protein
MQHHQPCYTTLAIWFGLLAPWLFLIWWSDEQVHRPGLRTAQRLAGRLAVRPLFRHASHRHRWPRRNVYPSPAR